MRRHELGRWLLGGSVALCCAQMLGAQEVAKISDASSTRITASVSRDADEGDEAAMRISMEFEDASLKDVLKIFSQQTGINLIASEDVSDRKVTVYFEDVAVLDALDQLLQAANLAYERPYGSQIYLVKPRAVKDAMVEELMTRVYRMRFARVSSTGLANAAQAASAGSASGSSGFSGSSTSSSTSQPLTGSSGTIDEVVKGLLTERGSVVVDGRTNSLIVTDIPENFPRLDAALAALDVRTRQVMIEAEILETSLAKVKDLGVEWDATTEGDVLTFTPGSSRKTRFPFGWLGHADAPTAPTAFGLSTLDFSTFKGVLQALERDTNTKVLARPKVLTLDNESAVIKLTSDQAVGFETTTGESTSTTSVTPERMETGVKLTVTPQVNDGGFITMLVEPSVTKVVKAKVTPPSGSGEVVDPKTRTAKALVRITQGQTLVLGGLIDRTEEQVVRKVPILGDLPLIGAAFRNTEINNDASEVIVFITPHILDEPETQVASAAAAPPVPILSDAGNSRPTRRRRPARRRTGRSAPQDPSRFGVSRSPSTYAPSLLQSPGVTLTLFTCP